MAQDGGHRLLNTCQQLSYLKALSKPLPFLFIFPLQQLAKFASLLKEGEVQRHAEPPGCQPGWSSRGNTTKRSRDAGSGNGIAEQLWRKRRPEETGKELSVCACVCACVSSLHSKAEAKYYPWFHQGGCVRSFHVLIRQL